MPKSCHRHGSKSHNYARKFSLHLEIRIFKFIINVGHHVTAVRSGCTGTLLPRTALAGLQCCGSNSFYTRLATPFPCRLASWPVATAARRAFFCQRQVRLTISRKVLDVQHGFLRHSSAMSASFSPRLRPCGFEVRSSGHSRAPRWGALGTNGPERHRASKNRARPLADPHS